MAIRPAYLVLACFLAPAAPLAAGPGKPGPDTVVTLTVTARVSASATWAGETDKHTPRNEEKDEFESALSETVVYRILEAMPDARGGGWRIGKVSHANRVSIAGGGTKVIEGDGGVRNRAEWTYSMPGACPGESRSRILRLGAARATVDVSRFFLCKVRARGAEKYVARWAPGAAAPTYESVPIDNDSTWALAAGKQVFEAFGKKHGQAGGNAFIVESSAMPIRGGSVQYSGNRSYAFETTDPAGRKLAGTVSAQVTIQVGEPPPPQKPVVVLRPPGDHGEWLPRDGNQTSVTCAWKGERATRVRFTLFEVSNEPGTCTNSPPAGSDPKADGDPDLAIVAKGDFRIEKVGDRTWTATGEAGGSGESVLEIASRDYAAWGKVKCAVEFDHEWHAGSAGGKAYLTIPLDEKENGIADRWETREGVLGKDVSEDKDTSSGNALDGDGFTIFEEYRGFMVLGEFKRTQPARKDLFIVNGVGTLADAGIRLFGSREAADLDVHQIRGDEYDSASRVVNFRKASRGKGGDQHGILLAVRSTRDGSGPEAEAVTVPAAAGATYTNSPGDVLSINFRSGFGSFGAAAAAKDVAHELGHACGLKHHGDAAADLSGLGAYEKDARGNLVLRDDEKGRKVRVYDAKGQEIGTRPLTIEDWRRSAPARFAGPASGDVNCIMTYDSAFSWSFKGEGGILHLANKPRVAPGRALCTSQEGTGYNAVGNRPYSLFGDAQPERSNCRSRIRVKDWE